MLTPLLATPTTRPILASAARSKSDAPSDPSTHGKGMGYLDNTGGDWPACFAASLGYLRHAWVHGWVGLPYLLERCAEFLAIGGPGQSDASACLLAAAHDVALQLEAEGAHTLAAPEPPYHNRLHFADTLTTLTLQVAIETAHCKVQASDWSAALLLVAIGHDFRHPGGVNIHDAQLEQQSFDALQPYLAHHQVAHIWVDRIQRVIVRSDFLAVPDNHRRVQGQKFSWCTDWATVLLNEADIMVSTSPMYGPPMGQALAVEWEQAKLHASVSVATPQGRSDFLKSVRFSSYSADVLGATEAVRVQLAAAEAAADPPHPPITPAPEGITLTEATGTSVGS